MLIFTDWLGLSLRIREDVGSAPAGHCWRDYSCTNVWDKRKVLYTEDGQRVATLLYKPRSSIIESTASLLEIENEWLYHGLGADKILELVLQTVPLEVVGISRLDLCVDFCPTEKQAEIIEGLASGKYYVQGKRSGSLFWSTNNNKWLHSRWNGRRIPHCQSWGHKSSSIKWKLYYKTKELLDAAGGQFFDKPYIVDQWRLAGMDITNVWRLEVSITHCNQQEYKGQCLDYQCFRSWYDGIFSAYYASRFIVRKNEGHADRSNDKVIQFLDVAQGYRVVRNAEAKTLAERSPRITLLRRLVKSMEDEAVMLDDSTRENVFWLVESVVERDNLQNYFRMMVGRWLEDWIEETRCFAAGLKEQGC